MRTRKQESGWGIQGLGHSGMVYTWQGPDSHKHVAWDPTFQPRSMVWPQRGPIVGLLKEDPYLCGSKGEAMNRSEGSSSLSSSVSCRHSPHVTFRDV